MSAAVPASTAAPSARSKLMPIKRLSPKANASNAVLASAAARPKPSPSDQESYGKEKSIGVFQSAFFCFCTARFSDIPPLLPYKGTLVR